MIELYQIPDGIPDNLDRSRPVVVIDIFRASTSITAALAAGAAEIHVAGSRSEADQLRRKIGKGVVMAGERGGHKIEGYDLGNSPYEMTPERVSGKTLVFNSTNGTKMLRRFADFKHVAVGSIVSLSATVEYLKKFDTDPIIACAGREGTYSGEDSLAAGLIISRLGKSYMELDDASAMISRLIEISGDRWHDWAGNSFHGRYLESIGLGDDLDYCLSVDKFGLLPVMSEGRLVSG